jgi:putative transposase
MFVGSDHTSKGDKPMFNDTPKLSDTEVLRHAKKLMPHYLDLHAAGYHCTTDDLYRVLLGVAANQGTIEMICADLAGAPAPETIRGYLNEQLTVEQLPDLERHLNAALRRDLPPRLRRVAQEVAMDFHDRPYYGKQEQDQALWVRGQAKDGTTRFYRVATAYVIYHGQRVTLALHFVLPKEETLGVLKLLRQPVLSAGVRISCLYLDKGFAGCAVIRYLQSAQQPALIACPIRGKSAGTRALCRGRKSYCTRYTFRSAEGTACAAELAVCRVFTTAKRTGRHERRAEWLIFILVQLDLTPEQARERYRRRFGVETSYRCAGQMRGWTTSPNPAYRFVLIGLSFLLLNCWVLLRWLFTQVPRRGRRRLEAQLFPLWRFAKFLIRALERHYGCVNEIAAPAVPRL